jgi:predicted transcriptional regulator
MSAARPRGVTRQMVLDYLIREADLDGLATVAGREIGEALGVRQEAVSRHIANLATDGHLTILGTAIGDNGYDGGWGYGSPLAIQLAKSVLA